MKILVVDDEAIVREILADQLKHWGYKVVIACDGMEALKIFEEKNPPQLAIIDWMMPNMNGIELIKKIRKLKNITQLFIIMLTALDDYEDIAKGIKAGADDFAIKPYRPEEFRVRIANGVHLINLKNFLVQRNKQLETAMEHIRITQQIFALCPHCKKLRDDDLYVLQLEEYLKKHEKTLAELVACPACSKNKKISGK